MDGTDLIGSGRDQVVCVTLLSGLFNRLGLPGKWLNNVILTYFCVVLAQITGYLNDPEMDLTIWDSDPGQL